jgi:hypothetical protein
MAAASMVAPGSSVMPAMQLGVPEKMPDVMLSVHAPDDTLPIELIQVPLCEFTAELPEQRNVARSWRSMPALFEVTEPTSSGAGVLVFQIHASIPILAGAVSVSPPPLIDTVCEWFPLELD